MVELLSFIMDGSGSMQGTKATTQQKVVEQLLNRLAASSVASTFRASLTYFSGVSKTERKPDASFLLEVSDAAEKLNNACNVGGGANTAAHLALQEQAAILDSFAKDDDLPDERKATVFIFTDGIFDNPTLADDWAGKIKSDYPTINPTVVTIAIGPDAQQTYLSDLASACNDRQRNQLDRAGVIKYLPNQNKLFLVGHEPDGTITKERVEAIRMFLNVLTGTVAQVGN